MSSQTKFDQPLTIAEAVRAITADRLLLPGIQRSFVWKPAQITTLFDSVMRGYPFGSVLVWRTRPIDHKQLRFRRLATQYDGGSTLTAPASPKSTDWIHAVLDGQQRLTAFNIGLRGSYSSSAKGEPRWLFLNLDATEADPGAEVNHYTFEFRADGSGGGGTWFRVADAVGLRADAASLDAALEAAGIARTAQHRKTLARLAAALNVDRVLRVEVERDASLDRVLNMIASQSVV